MHERKRVDHLDCAPPIQCQKGVSSDSLRACQAQQRPQPFSRRETGIPHRLMKRRWRVRRRWEQLGKALVDPSPPRVQLRFDVHRWLEVYQAAWYTSLPMAEIRPFHGLRYSPAAGAVDTLVAPPYDVLSEEERARYAAKNNHNIVQITLPESQSDDRSKFVKYGRSSARLAEWRRSGILKAEEKSTFYRYKQTFSIPGHPEKLERTAVIALLKTEPYEKGVVLPHEQTFPKHKEDRLRLLEATRTHVECIYGLCEDDGGFQSALERAPGQPLASITSEDGVGQVLEAIDDPDACAMLAAQMADKRLWIADGHHRYETACTFREAQGPRDGLIAEDFMMMAISSMADPGLVILPTHRIVPKLPMGPARLKEALSNKFNVRVMPNKDLMPELTRLAASDTRLLGVVLPGGSGLLLNMEEPKDALKWIVGPESDRLKMLDVTILHGLIFEQLLGLSGTDFFRYTRDPDEALRAGEMEGAAAFLMNPPSVEDMREIALGGEKMPQKSTYYFPKLLSGLVLWSLEDF